MNKTIAYKCPACGGALSFDSRTQNLKCPYCDSEYDVETFDETVNAQAAQMYEDETDQSLRIYVCQSCAGEIIADDHTGATICPYCGNKMIVPKQFEGHFQPRYIVPFRFDKKQAQDAYMAHLNNKDFVPPVFKEEGRIKEIVGLYVPFWLFDLTMSGEANYLANRTRTFSDGQYSIQEIKRYELHRAGDFHFEHVPADASQKMDDELMDSLEPIAFTHAKPFDMGYMAGYYASRYDVTVEASKQRIMNRVTATTRSALDGTVSGYDSYHARSYHVQLKDMQAYYALYPVWLLNIKWKDHLYTFAINGETGKLVGSFPFDQKAYWRYVLIHTPLFAAVIFALMVAIIYATGG